MVTIFFFSSQPAVQSSQLSGSLTRAILGSVWSWFAPSGQEVPEVLISTAHVLIRKSAHLIAFLVLGFCTANAVRYLTASKWRVFWISLCWSSAYGAIDELHQYFVPGRGCQWQDWLLDTFGAFLGVGIVMLIMRRRDRVQ